MKRPRPSVRLSALALSFVVFAAGCASRPSERAAIRFERESRWMRATYEAGNRRATFGDVTVYLGAPAHLVPNTEKVLPGPIDARVTEAPLLFPRTEPLAKGRPFRVFLDPGHGGADGGASVDGVRESGLVLDIAREVGERLRRDRRFEVFYSRPDDALTQKLADRVKKAKGADVFISIHLNANSSEAACGAETYRCTPVGLPSTGGASAAPVTQAQPGNARDGENLQLAFCLQRALLERAPFVDRGVRNAQYTVLREATVPAALVECGFLSNKKDRAFLQTEKGRRKIARGLADGIRAFCLGDIAE